MIQDTIEQRGNKYGKYAFNAELTQELMGLVTNHAELVGNELSKTHLESIHMIFHKISRMVNGDPWYSDNAHDIAGYATLLEEYINEANSSVGLTDSDSCTL
jgi:hypothetical protein